MFCLVRIAASAILSIFQSTLQERVVSSQMQPQDVCPNEFLGAVYRSFPFGSGEWSNAHTCFELFLLLQIKLRYFLQPSQAYHLRYLPPIKAQTSTKRRAMRDQKGSTSAQLVSWWRPWRSRNDISCWMRQYPIWSWEQPLSSWDSHFCPKCKHVMILDVQILRLKSTWTILRDV